jgi:hypothetical protein
MPKKVCQLDWFITQINIRYWWMWPGIISRKLPGEMEPDGYLNAVIEKGLRIHPPVRSSWITYNVFESW